MMVCEIERLEYTKRGQLVGIEADMAAVCDKINEIIDRLNLMPITTKGVVCADGITKTDCSG